MELKEIAKVFRRWWWLGVIPVLVVAVMILITYRPPAISYRVVLRFATGGEPAAELSPDYDRYYAWLASEYIANGLADLALSDEFARAVSTRLAEQQLMIPATALHAAIATDNAQSMLVVYITWPDPTQAVTIAKAVGETLIQAGPQYYPQMDNIGVVARAVDSPTAIPLPPSLRSRLLGPLVRLLLAAGIGILLVLSAHYLDPWIRDPMEVEALGLHVIAEIPGERRLPGKCRRKHC